MRILNKSIIELYTSKIVFCLTILFAIVISLQFLKPESFQDYLTNIKPFLDNCNSFDLLNNGMNIFLECISKSIFTDNRVFSFIESVLIIPVAYLFSKEITNRPIGGLITTIILVTSPTVYKYAVSAAYPELWALALLLSLYFILKKPVLMLPFFILSILAKPLALVYIPMIIILIQNTKNTIHTKLLLSSGLVMVFTLSMILWLQGHNQALIILPDLARLIKGMALPFVLMPYQFLTLATLPFVLSELILLYKKKVNYAGSIFVFIIGMLISFALLEGITNMTNQPYRFIPYMVICSIGLGMIIIKNGLWTRLVFTMKVLKSIIR